MPENYKDQFARFAFLGSFECYEKLLIKSIKPSNLADVKKQILFFIYLSSLIVW